VGRRLSTFYIRAGTKGAGMLDQVNADGGYSCEVLFIRSSSGSEVASGLAMGRPTPFVFLVLRLDRSLLLLVVGWNLAVTQLHF
jgi:hypothetical protein